MTPRSTRSLAAALTALALTLTAGTALAAESLRKAPPGEGYKKVSDLVPLPEFLPGMGTLYVKPETLPAGPFLAYDRQGRLVSSIYMVPLEDLQAHKAFDNLAVAGERVDHVDLYYNAGHPGVETPHYHIVLWHVSRTEEQRVAGK